MLTPPIRYATSPSPFVPSVLVHQGDCLDVLRGMPNASVDAIVTDPPYGLSDVSSHDTIQALTSWASGDRERVPVGRGFMGHDWDRFVPPPAVWDECSRVLKPGGHMAVFAGTRTEDLMGLSIRLAGFERRDTITWLYGSGFCKSKNVLKPASEPIIIVRKPFPGTVVANVLKHGTGGMNIDICRVGGAGRDYYDKCASVVGLNSNRNGNCYGEWTGAREDSSSPQGRWPANIVISHAATLNGEDLCVDDCVDGCAVKVLDDQSGISTSQGGSRGQGGGKGAYSVINAQPDFKPGFGDTGGASRFYNVFRYQAKAPKSERPVINGKAHPTVKPLTLISWLAKLLTPLYGVVLDPFAGSGTTGQAAHELGFDSILIENNPEYLPFIDQRLLKHLGAAA